jgi:carbamoyltransferase
MNRQLFEYDPTFAYRFIPNLKARVDHEGGGYLLRTNAQGFRCRHDFEAAKAAGVYRVLLFGDSYTAGDGVSNKHRFGDLIEDRIPQLELFNFGLSGSGTDQQYLIYRELGAPLEHDLVVIGVLVENIRRVVARLRPFVFADGEDLILAKPYFQLEDDGSLSLHHVPTPKDPIDPEDLSPEDRAFLDDGGRMVWLRQAVNSMGSKVKGIAQRLTNYQPLPEYDKPDDPAWLLMKAILTQWIGELGRPVILCPIPVYQYIEDTASPEAYRARFREFESIEGVTVHDPLDDFRAHSPAERREFRFPEDCHLTPNAHRVLAESLAAPIEAMMNGRGA